MSTTPSGEIYGKRLIPHVIDDIAKADPKRECFSIPLSSHPEDGWKAVSYGQYATAIDRLAHHIIKTSGAPRPKTFPTLTYIGANNATYLIFAIAAALFVSPVNSEEAQLHLFQLTDCHVIYHDAMFQQPVRAWTGRREGTTANLLAPLDFWLWDEGAVEPFPYVRTAEEAEWEPFVVLQTSGGSGLPRPVVVRNGLLMLNDKLHQLPVWNGTEPAVRGLARSQRNLTPMPFFHASGLYTFFGFHVYWEKPVTFAITDRPLTAEFVLRQLAHAPADVDSISLPPLILEELSTTDEGCEALGKMKFVVFGGGNLSDAAGRKLLDRGVVLQNSFGSTECGMLPYYWQANPQEYQWLPIHSEVLGAEWRPVAGQDDVFELVIVRKDCPSSIQGVFYTFPDLHEWSSRDLFRRHPTLPDHWKYQGRSDDLMVFSNGETLDPVADESALNRNARVETAIAAATMRSHSLRPADARASCAMSALLARYTQDLPAAPTVKKPAARTSQQTVVLTGSTGRLGAYLLDMLAADRAVAKIVCLDRARQPGVNAEPGLPPRPPDHLAKAEFLHADLARPDLGLGVEAYARLLADADRVIHAQWPAHDEDSSFSSSSSSSSSSSFSSSTLALPALKPHVRGVRNLADLCAGAARDVRLVLVSSVLGATGWDPRDPASRVPAGPYAQGMLVAERVLEAVAGGAGLSAAVVRVGQVAGPEDPAGRWSADDWLPRLVASSVRTLGVLPRDLGASSTVDWVTAEGAARLVLEAAAGRAVGGSGCCCDYYYGVNPHVVHFSTLSRAIKEFYGERVRELVACEDWLAALEESGRRGSGDAASNPALQSLDFYRGLSSGDAVEYATLSFSLDEILEASPTMREMKAITPELMVQWCRRWEF
ncbi:hypothetical protein PpBr36_07938 [Pyricularia pennisetigena]|uniref:hypothetical protein n=1 Tax=Pyricularia pennisetigena TaxID=1578925 RepID=UPI001150A756|nr:hypothetical protein PpBr36_07938 [Pyricularia pennisetigena]TLS25159.1 hypothetical protein PpBr36_07938 [Pyricularia pennisetigena]